MIRSTDTVDVSVFPFFEGEDVVIDLQVGEKDLMPVRMPILEMIDEYINFHSDMFQNVIATPNAADAKRLVGILRLAAHTLETTIA